VCYYAKRKAPCTGLWCLRWLSKLARSRTALPPCGGDFPSVSAPALLARERPAL